MTNTVSKLIIVPLVVASLFGAFLTPAAAQSFVIPTNTQNLSTAERDALTSYLIVLIQQLLAQLNKSTVVNTETREQNLTISDIDAGQTFTDCGTEACERVFTVVVKNDQYGSRNLSGEKAEYTLRIYEVRNGRNVSTDIRAEGEFLVPYANGYSEFEVTLEGGLPYDGEDREKTYRAKVEIDTNDDVDESNENDNTEWSDTWEVQHYKG